MTKTSRTQEQHTHGTTSAAGIIPLKQIEAGCRPKHSVVVTSSNSQKDDQLLVPTATGSPTRLLAFVTITKLRSDRDAVLTQGCASAKGLGYLTPICTSCTQTKDPPSPYQQCAATACPLPRGGGWAKRGAVGRLAQRSGRGLECAGVCTAAWPLLPVSSEPYAPSEMTVSMRHTGVGPSAMKRSQKYSGAPAHKCHTVQQPSDSAGPTNNGTWPITLPSPQNKIALH